MNGPLSDLGQLWTEMAVDTDAQVAALRRRAREMANALDREAMCDVEGRSPRPSHAHEMQDDTPHD